MAAGKMVSGGGVRLGRFMTSEAENPLFSRTSRTTLLHSFRKIQQTLDEWEGVTRSLSKDGAYTEHVADSAGFFINQGDRAKAAESLARGEYAEMPKLWGWRDEVQKRLVHRARALPVELPAIYLTSKAMGHFTQQPKDENQRVKWYNPVDVLGDFASFSVKNLTTMLAPWEVGTAGASVGWRRLMTYGDEVTNNPNFSPHIHNFSIGLHSSLSAMGQSATNILYETAKRANRTAGAFSTAVKGTTDARTPAGFAYSKRGKDIVKGFKQGLGPRDLLKTAFPDSARFFGLFSDRWNELGHQQANFEALVSHKKTYQWRGKTFDASRSNLPEGDTDIEQFAQIIHRLQGGEFFNQRRRVLYLQAIHKNLSGLPGTLSPEAQARFGVAGEQGQADFANSLNELVNHVRINLPGTFRKGWSEEEVAHERLSFGANQILHSPAEGLRWSSEFERRLHAIMPAGHAQLITQNLPRAIHKADIPFFSRDARQEMDERLRSEWQDLYHQGIIPAIRERSLQARLPSEMLDRHMAPQRQDMFVRRLASSFNMDTEGVTTFELRQQLAQLGIDSGDYHNLRAQLITRGVVSKPWQKDGFNVFGLRSLTLNEALQHNMISDRRKALPNQLARDIADPYLGDRSNIIAGRGIYMTSSGKVLDMRQAMGFLGSLNDIMARHLRIPILGFSPYDLFGYESRRKMRLSPLLQVQSGLGKHFPSEAIGFDTTVYVGGQRRGYGRLYGYTYGKEVQRSRDIVRPGGTRGDSIVTRGIRRGLGETGYHKEPHDTSTRWGRFVNWLDIGAEQPESLWGKGMRLWRSRAANRLKSKLTGREYEDDLENPSNYSRFVGGRTPGTPLTAEQTTAFRPWVSYLERNHVFSPVLADRLSKFVADNPDHQSLMGLFNITDPVTGQVRPLSQIHDAHIMYRSVEDMLRRDALRVDEGIASGRLNATARRELRSPQAFLRKSFLAQEDVPGAMEEMSPRAMEATQIHRRMDEFRAAVYRYQITAQTILHENGTQVMNDLLTSLDQMKAQKLIANSEYIEAKASILSVQVNLSTVRSYREKMSDAQRVQFVLDDILGHGSPQGNFGSALNSIADYSARVKNPLTRWFKAPLLSRLGAANESENFDKYSIYSPHQEYVYVPTTRSVLARNPRGGVQSLLGVNNWSDPNSFSMGSIVSGHLSDRLNRYFSMINLGLDQSKYRGSASYYAVGMVGKRVLPAMVGIAAFNTMDRTLGGLVYGKDQNGQRHYAPLVGGAAATALAHVDVALTPGKQRREKKREELFGSRLVPVRRGRFWLMGSSSFWGGRVMYWRPSWYQRYMSGYKYGPQGWHSPMQQALYGYDFSPLRPINPYKYEEQTYSTRPYPYTGNYFSGPWGPLTPLLNATVGHALKPHIMMHQQALYAQLNQGLVRVGHDGMVFDPPGRGSTTPLVATRNPTGSPGLFRATTTGSVLGAHSVTSGTGGGSGDWVGAYRQPYGFMGMPHGTHPEDALRSYRTPLNGRIVGGGGGSSRLAAAGINQGYLDKAGTPVDRGQTFVGGGGSLSPYYSRVVLGRPDNFDPRIMTAANPINPGSIKYQGGEFGYTAQEMAGIYGFGFGTLREMLGPGSHDFHPEQPVYQSADRAYGSERSFWDLNLGGLGDFPLRGISSEFDSIEASEIIRRFVPHRRREINEINPIPNAMGMRYPWLPGGSDYFVDFTRGDPYSNISEGELRLPGSGYERTHQLHPDATGRYGLLDQLSILGDVAPWSPQYKALNQAMSRMKSTLSPEDQRFLVDIHNRTAAEKKRHNFYPYKYAHANFQSATVKVTGFVPGEADQLVTSAGVVQLSGVRSKRSDAAEQWLHDMVSPGDKIKITYDANYPPQKGQPLDAIVEVGGKNLNEQLAAQQDLSYPSRKSTPLDNYMRMGSVNFHLHAAAETVAHLDTVFNNKFFQHRTAIEDWERSNVYGSSFPRWENPIQSYIKPLGYRALNRNPISATLALGMVGRMFGRRRESKKIGAIVGATSGFLLSTFSNAQTLQTGDRWLPQQYEASGAVDEYKDILNYMRYARAYSDARAEAIKQEHTDPEKVAKEIANSDYKKLQYTNIGPATSAALTYRNKMRSTLYGADPFGDVMQLSQAIPRQQRDHFMEFLNAPVNERQQILSVMPRLERRIFEARWGMQVEKRPDLVDYFSQHELPDQNWEGWSPNADMEDIKIKILQNQGLNLSQLGYYPQQISEANALNYSYPDYKKSQSVQATVAQLNQFFSSQGINSSVQAMRSNQPGTRVEMQMGVSS